MAKSYYAILGVSFGATQNQIRSAYRQLAKEYHPDHYSGGSKPFRELQEAYAVLSRPPSRMAYDRQLTEQRESRLRHGPQYPTRPEPVEEVGRPAPVDVGSISLTRSFRTYSPSFDEIFDRLWSNFTSMSRPKGERLRNLAVEILLTPEEAQRGGQARVFVPAKATCPTCRGRGAVGPYTCWRCAGEGAMSGEFPVTVSFPPGVPHDHAVAIPLEKFGIRNLYLTVHFRVSDYAEP